MSDAAPVVLTLSPVLDLTAAEPLKAELLAHRGRVLVVDASGVERLGGLCLQVLLSALSLWRQDEIEVIRQRFDKLAQKGKPVDGYWDPQPQEDEDNDLLKRYPRVMMPHRWDDLSRSMLIDPRIGHVALAHDWRIRGNAGNMPGKGVFNVSIPRSNSFPCRAGSATAGPVYRVVQT